MLYNLPTLASPTVFAPAQAPEMCTIHRYGRFWQVLDPTGDLVCITVYKRGAQEVVRRLYVKSTHTSASPERKQARATVTRQCPPKAPRRAGG
jgi:hypothetical protein